MKSLALILSSSLIMANAALADDDASCKLDAAQPDLICNLDSIPAYFANVTPDGQYVAYIDYHDPRYGGISNWLVKLGDCKTKIRVPNLSDPVPSPDNQFIATPNTPLTPRSGYSLFRMKDIIATEKEGETVQPNVKPADFEPKISASYESIGILPLGSGKPTTYRISGGSAVFNDFEVHNGNPIHVGEYNRAACTNINKESNPNKLPMISKDGTMLGDYNTATGLGRTQIYDLHDDGLCDLALDLGIPTGKVAFSYDGKHIAFHVDSFAADGSAHFAVVGRNMVKNVYVVDVDKVGGKLVPKGIRRITNDTAPGSGSYYPTFDKSGKIVYLHQSIDDKGKVSYSFQQIDPNLSPAKPLYVEPGSNQCRVKDSAAFFALGGLYQCVCPLGQKLQGGVDPALWTLGLDPAACQRLVKTHWMDSKNKIKGSVNVAAKAAGVNPDVIAGLTVDDLLAACPGKHAAGPSSPVVLGKQTSLLNEVPDDGQRDPAKIFATTCAECHNGHQQDLIDWTKLAKDPDMQALIPDMIRRIGDPSAPASDQPDDDDRMPKGSKMNAVQAKILVQALKGFEK